MNILYLCDEYPPELHGGIGVFVKNIAEKLYARGHRVTVCGWSPSVEQEVCQTINGVLVYRRPLKSLPIRGKSLAKRVLTNQWVRRLVRVSMIDIVEFADFTSDLIFKVGVPTVIRLHGSHCFFGSGLGEKVSWKLRVYETLAMKTADYIVGASQYMVNWAKGYFSSKIVNDSKTCVIHNGVDTNVFVPPRNSDDEPIVLNHGTLSERKGSLDIARAMAIVFKRIPDVKLIFIGRETPGIREKILAAIGEHHQQRVVFIPPIPNESVVEYIQRARLCVYATRIEPFGIVFVESMACGKPVIATRVGGVAEIIEDGKSGILVDIGDVSTLAHHIIRLWNDPIKRQQLGRNALEHVRKNFSYDVLVDKNVQLYQRLCRGFIER